MDILFEVIFRVVFELALDWCLDKASDDRSGRITVVGRIIAHVILGALAGFIGVYLVPQGFLTTPEQRISYMLASPFLFALVIVWLRGRLGWSDDESFMAQFVPSLAFGLAFNFMRYVMVY